MTTPPPDRLKRLLAAGLEGDTASLHAPPGTWRAPDPAALAGVFPGLEPIALLGQGGMGAVYQARQARLDRVVALKVLSPQLAADPAFAERFQREALALARLSHPHIVALHDVGEAGGWRYLVMEYVPGATLRQALRTGAFTPREALALVPQLCDALDYAHAQGVVHRDLKPENILLDERGRARIADFGLAKLGGEADPGITRTGQVLGTAAYMAPEQMAGSAHVDHRADLYALGVLIYEMLTGELPVGRFALPSQRAQVDVRMDEVVLRALERTPELRWQSADAVRRAVETAERRAAAPPAPPAAPPPGPPRADGWMAGWRFWAAWAAGIAVGFLVYHALARGERGRPAPEPDGTITFTLRPESAAVAPAAVPAAAPAVAPVAAPAAIPAPADQAAGPATAAEPAAVPPALAPLSEAAALPTEMPAATAAEGGRHRLVFEGAGRLEVAEHPDAPAWERLEAGLDGGSATRSAEGALRLRALGPRPLRLAVQPGALDEVTVAGDGTVALYGLGGPAVLVRQMGDGQVTIDRPRARRVELRQQGAGRAYILQATGTLALIQAASASADLEVDVDALDLVVAGAGRVDARGRCERLHLRLASAGRVAAPDLAATTASVVITGTGTAELGVLGALDATCTGGGSLRYGGNPRLGRIVTGDTRHR